MQSNVTLAPPTLDDGMAVNQLISECPPLDTNSSYCNLLQCSHFSSTSVAAFAGDELVGFISGYLIPERMNTLFVWQVAVSERARGLGLASQMLSHILDRDICNNVKYIETSITEDNKASLGLFTRFAAKRNVDITSSPWMDKAQHFQNQHDSEPLVRLGPF